MSQAVLTGLLRCQGGQPGGRQAVGRRASSREGAWYMFSMKAVVMTPEATWPGAAGSAVGPVHILLGTKCWLLRVPKTVTVARFSPPLYALLPRGGGG